TTSPPSSSGSAQGLVELEIRHRRREARANDADVVVLEQPAQRDAVVERDRRSRCGHCLLARAAQNLTGREEPARGRGPVVVERAAEIADALAADLAAVLPDHDRG